MDLILWRHAEAEDSAVGGHDMQRALTVRGREQARRMAAWLDPQLPEDTRVLCSPALRCQQTALTLRREYSLCSDLAPAAATPGGLLTAAGWPDGKSAVLLVGHQPTLGQVIALLADLPQTPYPLHKGAACWLRARECDGLMQTVVVSMQSPELL